MKPVSFSWLFLIVTVASATNANQESLQAVTRSNNLFSSDLYDVLRKSSNDNLILSPVSVTSAFAMLLAGARGVSRNSIRSSFHFPTDDDQLNSGFQILLQQLRGDENVTLEMANRIFPAQGYPLNPQFADTLKNYYAAEPQQLNFAENVEAAGIINNFVSNATHDKVRDLIDSKDLSPDTRLVLVNAIYFKGNWKTKFRKASTRKEDFYVSENEQSIEVDMMSLGTSMLHADIPELGAEAVSLPYSGGHPGGNLSMIILLPKERYGLEKMEEKLKNISLETIIDKMESKSVHLRLPKFKLESNIDLQESLTQLGLGGLFTPMRADLSGIPEIEGGENLYVSKAVHKAFIEVNEEGSEAAGATAINIWDRTASNYHLFNCEHPYSFALVKHSTAGVLPLFTGRVVKPTQS